MLGGLRGGRVRGVFWGRKFRLMFQMIDDELDDDRRADGRGNRYSVAQRMPGAPVLQRCFVGARRVARGAFMEEGRDGVFGFVGQPLCIFQGSRRLREQRREREEGSLGIHLGCSVGGADSPRKLGLIQVLLSSKNDNHHLSLNRPNTARPLLPQLEKSSFIQPPQTQTTPSTASNPDA